MKLSCTKNELIGALQIVSKAVPSKPQMPILSGIYLKATEGNLELQATNNELSLKCSINADVSDNGEIVLSGRYFQEVVRKLPGDTVNIELNVIENIVKINSGSANFTLLRMSSSEFPVIKPLEGNIDFTLKDNTLRDLIKKTAFACATDEGRPVFTGCCLEINDASVVMAATNTHRLAVKREILNDFHGNFKIIIPAKVLNELIHIMTSEIPTDVKITCNYNQISFTFDNIYMASRLIEGNFPAYQRVIPDNFTTSVTVNTADFTNAVDRVSLISRAGEYNVIRLDFSNNQIHISSNNPDIGNAEEVVSAQITGPDVNIAFNAQYVTDGLKTINSENCIINLNKTLDPTAIKESADDTFIYIVTPVRTNH